MTNHSSLESVVDEIRTTELATTTQFVVVDHSSKGCGSYGMVVVEVVFKLSLLIFGHFLPFHFASDKYLDQLIRTVLYRYCCNNVHVYGMYIQLPRCQYPMPGNKEI